MVRWKATIGAARPRVTPADNGLRPRTGDGYDEANATAERFLEAFPGMVHIQAVRMAESEEKLEAFYRHWKEKTDNVIVQKYDCYGGVLPQRKVTDLSPLQRSPCWHLKRDLVVRIDGTVSVCRQDLARRHTIGNILSDDLSEIWGRGAAWYRRHIDEDYPELCQSCDEYYTYNF